MEPFSPIDRVWILEGLFDASNRNFANPKSPTWATISLSRSTLLGFRSQWTIGFWQWWWRYSNALATSMAMFSLWIKLNLLLWCCSSFFGCNHWSRLPLHMNSKIRLLKSFPSWSMLEQAKIILRRLRWRILLKALHSSMKILDAPCHWRFRKNSFVYGAKTTRTNQIVLRKPICWF